MPHNRTRIWAGLAIAGVTIPAVGEFYSRTATPDLLGNPIARNARLPLGTTRPVDFGATPTASDQKSRDYQAELDAKLAPQASPVAFAGSEDDPTFDVSPYDEGFDVDAGATADTMSLPTLPAALASSSPTVQDAPSDSNEAAAPSADVEGASDLRDPAQATSGDLSDADVYRIVLNGLPADQREDFALAYAAMSPSQRAQTLQEFRSQMQGGPSR